MATIKTVLIVLVVSLTVSLSSGESSTQCNVLPDGHYNIGCKAYDECKNHEVNSVECAVDMVYDHTIPGCNSETLVGPPCGLYRDCSNKQDDRYVDLELNCTSYYTCHNHVYYGHNFCPQGLVFESTLGTCVWLHDAYPPCGTKS